MTRGTRKVILERLATGREFTSTELSERARSTVPETQAYLRNLQKKGLVESAELPGGGVAWSTSKELRS